MSDSHELTFVETDTEALTASLVATYQRISGRTLYPASPERLFIAWMAQVLVQERALINQAARRNLPRYADGGHLDALAELFHKVSRLPASPAATTMRFYVSGALSSAQLVPRGTRVSPDGGIFFATTKDAYVPAGELSVTVAAECMTVGDAGNGFAAGQIKQCVDVYPYFDRCENSTASAGGAQRESDTGFYLRMRASEDTYSTAGPMGGYEYWAKTAKTVISDVRATSPSPGKVDVYVLAEGGRLPDEEILSAVERVLTPGSVRPLTDLVEVLAPETVAYQIALTYYLPSDSAVSASIVEQAVAAAVEEYQGWQSARMGRDINPSKLISLLMATGIKRVALTAPLYAAVSDGSDGTAAQVASAETTTIINGGIEDE